MKVIMRISDAFVEKLLKKNKNVDGEQLKALLERVKTEKKPLQELVVSSNIISETDLTKAYAEEIEVPFVEIDPKALDKELMQLIPERAARQYMVVITGVGEDGAHELAMEDPDDVQAINFMQKQVGKEIRIYVATRTNILAALDQYRGNIGSEISKVASEGDEAAEAEEEVSKEDVAEDSPIAQTVNLIIEYAIKSNASDIHIEPREKHVQVRYRIDGVLREANKLPKRTLAALVSRIKILSGLKIDERRAPQDGRFKITLNSRNFAFRVSTLPITDGEKVVMRVLDESSDPAPWNSSASGVKRSKISTMPSCSRTAWCWSLARRVLVNPLPCIACSIFSTSQMSTFLRWKIRLNIASKASTKPR
jgi:type IV pilus assembly protein PilB